MSFIKILKTEIKTNIPFATYLLALYDGTQLLLTLYFAKHLKTNPIQKSSAPFSIHCDRR